ncbi:hypothetical protein AB4Y89_20525 [Terriglobus sp. 2YAB30_2]|uniref:hypothetical protein n=1 Tax=Terriglobus sp. 2YAB30_2 TaxID=3233023 RepID=UPI003F982211
MAPRKSKKAALVSTPQPQPLLAAQPQSAQQAAVQKGLFLYTDDSWSQDYFNKNDLHFIERELFG